MLLNQNRLDARINRTLRPRGETYTRIPDLYPAGQLVVQI